MLLLDLLFREWQGNSGNRSAVGAPRASGTSEVAGNSSDAPELANSTTPARSEPTDPSVVTSKQSEQQQTDTSPSADDAPPEDPVPSRDFSFRPLDQVSPSDDPGGSTSAGGGDAEFFGLTARGKRFVYVVDASGSMATNALDGNYAPFDVAYRELLTSLRDLDSQQRFLVIFFNNFAYPQEKLRGRELWPATPRNIKEFEQWAAGITPDGGTEPLEALLQAIAVEPDAIFFLTDGQFDPSVAAAVKLANSSRTAIHAIGVGQDAAEELLRTISRDSSGTFRLIDAD